MPNIFNADNGVVSGSAGIKLSSDTSGVLNIQTNGTTAISISASQVVSFPATSGFSFAGQVTFAAGTAAAPSISVTGDTNTGIYFPAADTIGFVEGGVEALRIDSSANVGIGTSSPTTKLHVNTGAAGYGITVAANIQTSRTYQIGVDSNSNLAFYESVAAAQRLVLDTSGNLGLGVTPSAWFSASRVYQFGSGGALEGRTNESQYSALTANQYIDSAGTFRYIGSTFASRYQQYNGIHSWSTAASGTAGNAITFTQAMTLTAGGLLQVSGGSTNTTYTSSGEIALKNSGSTPNISWHSDTGTRIGYLQMQSSGIATLSVGVNQPLVFETNATERARITAAGDFGVGTSSPTTFGAGSILVTAAGTTAYGGFIGRTNTVTVQMWSDESAAFGIVGTRTNHPTVFTTNNNERARIDTLGNLLIGTTSHTSGGIQKLIAIDGPNNCGITFNRSGAVTAYIYTYSAVGFRVETGSSYGRIEMVPGGSNGVYMDTGATSWTAISDERSKDIIEPITGAAEKVSSLRAVIGKYKSDADGTRRSFLIAQDVDKVLPEAVDKNNEGEWGLSYTDTIPLLVAAIKELKAELDQLKGAQ